MVTEDKPSHVQSSHMTLTDAKSIIRHRERYKKKHRRIAQSESGAVSKRRKMKRIQIEYMKAVKSITPTHLSVDEKIKEAQNLLRLQTRGSYNPGGFLVKSPPFQGGRMLRGGLPGSKR